MNNLIFGKYVNNNSFLTKLDARFKLLAMMALVVFCFLDLNIYFERSHSVYIGDNLGKTIFFMDPMARNKIEYKIQIRDRHIVRASKVGGHEIILPYVLHARFYLNDGILRLEAVMRSGKIREREFVVATFKK